LKIFYFDRKNIQVEIISINIKDKLTDTFRK